MNIKELLGRAIQGEELNFEEGLFLLQNCPVNELAAAAHKIRERIKGNSDVVTWQIDRNINITNVCISGCKFCNFHSKVHQTHKHFITSHSQYRDKVEELFSLGGQQILLQGGMHPKLDIEWYEELFRWLKFEFPTLKLHALGAPEIAHIARISGLDTFEVLQRLVAAGLDSLPGAGAEILDSEFRRRISPNKCSAEQWIEIVKQAHSLNLPTSATMVYGIDEGDELRVKHLIKIRELQNCKDASSRGFIAFIVWPFSIRGTRLESQGVVSTYTAESYIRMIALSRIMIQNIDNIQASWLTVGRDLAQIALHAGANDLGSIMIEENVVASTGLNHKMDAEGMQNTIIEAGFSPRLRDQLYEDIDFVGMR